MYHVLPGLRQPNADDKLWRYMSLANFVALLVEQYLFFSKLKHLEDPYEGAPPLPVIALLREDLSFPRPHATVEQSVKQWFHRMEACRERTCVNCWHVSDHESEAMWKLYGQIGENVCIVTDISSLRKCFENSPTAIQGGMVDYQTTAGAFDSNAPVEDYMFAWATRKRRSYEHEREFRLLHLQSEDGKGSRGTHFRIDPSALVKEVLLSPSMPAWQILTLHNLVDRLGYVFPIRESNLLRGPFELPWYRISQ